VKSRFYTIILCLLGATIMTAESIYPTTDSYYEGLKKRQENIFHGLTGRMWKEGDDGRMKIYLGMAKLYTGVDVENGLKLLNDVASDPKNFDCFNSYSMMDCVLRFWDKLPGKLINHVLINMASRFGENKGFTENHKLMYRTARYLYGQTWPDGPKFADGMTPVEGMKEAEEWINNFIDRATSLGMMEYDSVNYHSFYLLCFTSLYDFSTDQLMRQKAWMMMQLLLADWAPEYLKGNWIGSHSREKHNQATHTIFNSGTAIPFGYLFFGDSTFYPSLDETFYVLLGAIQDFRPLSIIGDIATNRSKPYVHKETKAPRRGFGCNTSDLPTWKYDYVTKDYALSSSYGDITAVENHRWDLTWVSPRDGSTLFFINPSYSGEQLSKYFDGDKKTLAEKIAGERPYYKDPNKWVEGSQFEKMLQHENSIIVLYDIPKDERNQNVNGFFSKAIENRVEEDGWIFCDTDNVYIAVKPLTKGVWHEEEDHFRFTLNSSKTGIVMEVAQKSEYPSFDAFKAQIKKNNLSVDIDKMHVAYTDSRGDKFDYTYPDKRSVNGKAITFDNWPLFGGPFVNSIKGSKIINLTYGKEKVTLDFNRILPDFFEAS
jgi:hypothetical protein